MKILKTLKSYTLYTLLVAFLMVGCKEMTPEEKTKVAIASDGIDIIEVDGCEYVRFIGYYKGGITHKGNCKNQRNCRNH